MKNINGLVLKQMIISGANNLYNSYPEIDALNVFPVPDGDTGTNMNLTISSGAKEVANRNDTDVYEIAKAFSKGLLMGARGNSGVILSQIFRGFAQSLEGKKVINPTDFAEAFMQGKSVSYKAVMRPVEGTILTVVREAAQALADYVTDSMSIEKCIDYLLKEARESLQRTPELLPVLKEVGVVDSGGAGFVKILEGFQKAILGQVVEKTKATAFDEPLKMAGSEVQGDEFGYCTEFILRLGNDENKKTFVEKRFANVLGSHGNSLVVVRDEDIVKVHVHTMIPGNILTYAQQYGEFVTLKIENMSEQHTKLEENRKLEAEKSLQDIPLKEYALIAVAVGDGVEKMFKELRVDEIVSGGQTMNPSAEDFVEAIKKCHAKQIFILPNNSNIIMSATQACDIVEGVKASVIPSKTIPQGLVACMMFNPDATFEENFEEMKDTLKTVHTGSVTFAIKDTKIDGVAIKKGQFMGIKDKKIVCSEDDKIDAAYQLICKMIDQTTSIITLIVGEDVKEEEAQALANRLIEENDDIDIDLRIGNQPVYSFIIGVE